MKTTGFVAFQAGEEKALLEQFGFSVQRNKKKTYVMDQSGNQMHCPSCDRPITTKHVGSIASGSRIVFCDNPVCFATWVAKEKV